MNTNWTITYVNRSGETKTTNFVWGEEKPTVNDVAIGIREELLGKQFVLVDMPRGQENPAAFLLESYGFKITGIEKAPTSI